MVLKSYSTFKGKKKKKKKRSISGMVVGGVTAIIGVGLLSQTAEAVNRI